jgi:predicted tellurium resistance membrane protein TerC
VTGGILGIVAMRVVVGQLIALVQRYPALVDGAFIIIAWVGFKLCWEYLNQAGIVHAEIPQWFSLGLIAVIFTAAFIYAKMQGPVDMTPLGEVAEQALDAEAEALEVHDPSVHK